MSKKTLNPKSFPAWMASGEPANTDVRGINKEYAAIRDKFRSPFAFSRGRRTKN